MNSQSKQAKCLDNRLSKLFTFVFALCLIGLKYNFVYAAETVPVLPTDMYTNYVLLKSNTVLPNGADIYNGTCYLLYESNAQIKLKDISTDHMSVYNSMRMCTAYTYSNSFNNNITGHFSNYNFSTPSLEWRALSVPATKYCATGWSIVSANNPVVDENGNNIKLPFTGDSRYQAYTLGAYNGLIITNPYNGVDFYSPTVEVVAHARIQASNVALSDIVGDVTGVVDKNYEDDLVTKIKNTCNIYVNGTEQLVEENVTFDKWEFLYGTDSFYNITIKCKVSLREGGNIIKIRSDFFNGPVSKIEGNHLLTDETKEYSDSITLKFIPFIPITTTTTGEDGTITKTTTNPSGTVDTEIIKPNGEVTVIPGDILPKEIDKDYTGLFGGIQKALDTIVEVLCYPFKVVGGIFASLFDGLMGLTENLGDVVPFLKEVFGFLPPQALDVIVCCFGFLGIGVFLRTFGRK